MACDIEITQETADAIAESIVGVRSTITDNGDGTASITQNDATTKTLLCAPGTKLLQFCSGTEYAPDSTVEVLATDTLIAANRGLHVPYVDSGDGLCTPEAPLCPQVAGTTQDDYGQEWHWPPGGPWDNREFVCTPGPSAVVFPGGPYPIDAPVGSGWTEIAETIVCAEYTAGPCRNEMVHWVTGWDSTQINNYHVNSSQIVEVQSSFSLEVDPTGPPGGWTYMAGEVLCARTEEGCWFKDLIDLGSATGQNFLAAGSTLRVCARIRYFPLVDTAPGEFPLTIITPAHTSKFQGVPC